ncbi:hypothetical protein KBC97_02825, partial [Candidatus Gracilibacteria bacterium]|nr:hypothetical protein [Candidatus Gracilibacteria bacterium]
KQRSGIGFAFSKTETRETIEAAAKLERDFSDDNSKKGSFKRGHGKKRGVLKVFKKNSCFKNMRRVQQNAWGAEEGP